MMWEMEAEGYRRLGYVVSQASQLQQSLLHRGFYNKDRSRQTTALRTAIWLQQSLKTLESHGTWCPDSIINIEG